MNYRILVLLVCTFLSLKNLHAQSPAEKLNRAVFNQIEYFFNINQPDSIYNLASESFKQNIERQSFINFLSNLYTYGKMSGVTPATFSNNTAGYNVLIGDQKFSIHLAVDSTKKFNYFLVRPNHIVDPRITPIQAKVNKQNSLDEFIDSIARAYLTHPSTQSLAIGVLNNGQVNTFFYGQLDPAEKLSIPNEHTLYEVGSLTKLFTSVLLAHLVEEGSLSLEDSIAKFLPDSVKTNPFIRKITFKQLANHTSGLPRLPSNLDKVAKFSAANPYANYTRKDLFHFLKDFNGQNEPGENYEYSNLGFGLLGELISIITNKSFAQNIKDLIAEPLGMHNTVEKINPKNQVLAKPHNAEGRQVPAWDFLALAGAGSLKSSVHDLLRFAQFQFKLPETTLEKAMMLTREFTFYLPPNTDIGLGWHMNMLEDVVQYWHTGGTGGSSSFLGIVPDKKSAIVVLSNSAISVDEISSKILEKIAVSK